MKLSVTSATFALALVTSVTAAPPNEVKTTKLTKREVEQLNSLSLSLNTLAAKRDLLSPLELAAREYETLTEILKVIESTDLAPKIIDFLVSDSTIGPIITKVTVNLIKSGAIDITTLFTALNDSGLAAQVVEALINDCEFYAEIFKIVGEKIADLGELIHDKLTGSSKRDIEIYEQEVAMKKAARDVTVYRRADDDNTILENVLESLKNSNLAVQVVTELITDSSFLKWGANLVQQLFSSKAITLSELISAIAQSGLIPSLIKEFLTLDTLKAVIVNSLAAAFDNCGNSSLTTSTASATQTTSSGSSSTATKPSTCKRKRKRSYNY
ncbi:uncharacterized protein PRCAT00000280001 [Priceomyces carsonii]|uniref:uncharacterized protein n=1 Tax=Priceomyces carsonii TaxID=28549 RepID=UPI002EDA6C0F|nr:unnamed protein product [Priceomyces carsonii]